MCDLHTFSNYADDVVGSKVNSFEYGSFCKRDDKNAQKRRRQHVHTQAST